MTLEEHIADEKQRIDALLKSAAKLKPNDVTIRKLYEEGAEEHREKASLLEELRVLRKAYDLVCEHLGYEDCCEDAFKHKCDNDCATHWGEYFIKEARTENEDNSTN